MNMNPIDVMCNGNKIELNLTGPCDIYKGINERRNSRADERGRGV